MSDRIRSVLALCFLFILFGCQRSASDTSPLDLQGYVEGELSYIASPFSGELKILSKQRGDSIKQGEPLFVLEQEPQSMQLLGAQASVLQAQSHLDLVKARLERSEKLYQQKAIGKDDLDAAVDARNEAQNRVEEAQQKEKESSWSLSEKAGKAPVDGFIYDTYFRKGEWVATGTPILSILAPENIKILFFVPEKRIQDIKIQEKIQILVQNKSYEAKIEYISPEVEYTPPVIFSRENDAPLVFRVRAIPLLAQAFDFHPGQPVMIRLKH